MDDGKMGIALGQVEDGHYKLFLDGRCRNNRTGKFRGNVNNWGYLINTFCGNKKTQTVALHRLIYRYFKGEIPKGYHVNHIDGNKQNNNIRNLEAITHQENLQHARDTGLYNTEAVKQHYASMSGEDNPNSALSNEQAKEIRGKYQQGGISKKALAREFSVGASTVARIIKGERYPYMPV